MFNTCRLPWLFAVRLGGLGARVLRIGGGAVTGVAVGVLAGALSAVAHPAEVFHDHLDRLQSQMPPGYVMRLPEEILLGGPGMEPAAINQLIVKVLPTNAPPQIIVTLQTCEAQPYPCLLGSFSAARADSPAARAELAHHQAKSTAITLAPNVQGFLLQGDPESLPPQYASVMWEQDGMIYAVRFLAAERQNMLYMARSMAIHPPILPEHTSVQQ